MTDTHRAIFLASCLLLITTEGYADQTTPSEDIYYYHKGQQAAGRIQNNSGLSESQIQQAILGFEAKLRQQPPLFTPAEIQQVKESHQESLQAAREALGQENLLAGQQYLDQLETRPDYQFLDQGLAYKINTTGAGDIPSRNSQVRIQYIGTHLDGSEFDRSTEAVWSSIQSVLPGWRIALLNMPAGSQWTVIIPPHLAYGEQGTAERIGPHETLLFELHLLGVR